MCSVLFSQNPFVHLAFFLSSYLGQWNFKAAAPVIRFMNCTLLQVSWLWGILWIIGSRNKEIKLHFGVQFTLDFSSLPLLCVCACVCIYIYCIYIYCMYIHTHIYILNVCIYIYMSFYCTHIFVLIFIFFLYIVSVWSLIAIFSIWTCSPVFIYVPLIVFVFCTSLLLSSLRSKIVLLIFTMPYYMKQLLLLSTAIVSEYYIFIQLAINKDFWLNH